LFLFSFFENKTKIMMNKVYFLYEIYAEIYADNIKAINGIAVQQLF